MYKIMIMALAVLCSASVAFGQETQKKGMTDEFVNACTFSDDPRYTFFSSSTSSSCLSTSTSSSPTLTTDEERARSEPETFVLINMETLAIDIAAGKGETIDALAVLIGVEDVAAFGRRLQANFSVIYLRHDVGYEHVTYNIIALS